MPVITCPACQAYLGLGGARAETCNRCGAELTAPEREPSRRSRDDREPPRRSRDDDYNREPPRQYRDDWDDEPARPRRRDERAATGQQLLFGVTLWIAFSGGVELLALMNGWTGSYGFVRLIVTLLLTRGLWQGSRLSRVLVGGMMLLSGAGMLFLLTTLLPSARLPMFAVAVVGLTAVLNVACGLTLFSPQVGAYMAEVRRKAARKKRREEEEDE